MFQNECSKKVYLTTSRAHSHWHQDPDNKSDCRNAEMDINNIYTERNGYSLAQVEININRTQTV